MPRVEDAELNRCFTCSVGERSGGMGVHSGTSVKAKLNVSCNVCNLFAMCEAAGSESEVGRLLAMEKTIDTFCLRICRKFARFFPLQVAALPCFH